MLDLGSMPAMSATVNTDSQDVIYATIIPVVLAAVAVPFVIMRASMMELDCFIARRKQIDGRIRKKKKRKNDKRIEQDEVDGFLTKAITMSEAVLDNAADKELKARLYVTVCCSVLGMCVFTALMIVTGGLLAISLQ